MSETPAELPQHIADALDEVAEAGTDLLDEEDWDGALARFRAGLALIPEPKREWEASTWLNASIGDAHFFAGRYAEARDAFYEASQCPGGLGNPYVQLRLGETELELGHTDAAANALIGAYMQEGREIFEDEDPKYLVFLREAGLLPSTD
ncbi:tetratricopeptide repeat protein [Enemella evansiae]|uniref:tetratricopeptide repeat protein n=1 Tax=Enemella evansiae TaxID=2016499 RepID=UPI001E604532|nr:hypothetical protein [Enemella evansiae]